MKTVASAANAKNGGGGPTVNNNNNASSAIVIKSEATLAAAETASAAAAAASSSSITMQFQAPNAAAPNSGVGNNNNNPNKRPISLDLNLKPAPAKKQRLVAPSPLILESPDLQNIKTLNTPDLEKILLSSNLLQTPQPGLVFPTKVGPLQVTSEQEAFGKGFEEALHSLHNSKNSLQQTTQFNNVSGGNVVVVGSGTSTSTVATTAAGAITATAATAGNTSTTTSSSIAVTVVGGGTGMSGGSFTYTHLESSFPVAIKDEPQNPPSSPPVSPIDMETQEKIKLERKRQRNRVAASKCRKRKLERISKLEDKVKILKTENADFSSVVKSLKDHVAQLKQQVIEHIEIGCSIPTIYNGSNNALLQGK